MVGAVLLTFATMGVSKLSASEERRDEIAAIGRMLDQPANALERLDKNFGTDLSGEVLDLRMRIEDQLRKDEALLVEAWDRTFDLTRQEAVEGEILLALEMYRELPDPPTLRVLSRPWRSSTEILSALTERLRSQIISLGPPTIHAPRQITVEKEVLKSIETLEDALTEDELSSPLFDAFRSELTALTEETINRERTRSVDRLEAEHARILKENDQLLELAHRALEEARFEDALEHYESILENDPAGKVRRVLEQEVAFTRRKLDAAARAKEAASRGEHHIALDILQGTFDDAERVLLPWNIETTPPESASRSSATAALATPRRG